MVEPVNPYVAGKVVKSPDMFFGRDDVFEFIRERLAGRYQDSVILLHGQSRSGKTSILYQLHRHVDERYLCVYVELHGVGMQGMAELLMNLAKHIQLILSRDYRIAVVAPDAAKLAADPRGYFRDSFLEHVEQAIGDHDVLLMLDEMGRLHEQVRAGGLQRDVFDYLRHLVQHCRQINFLFSLGNEYEEMRNEYPGLFSLGLEKGVSLLDPLAAERLVTVPAKELYTIESAARTHLLSLTAGHPYVTQLLCQCLFARCLRERLQQVDVSVVDAVIEEMFDLGASNLQSFWRDASSCEKALMAGFAAVMDSRGGPVSIQEVRDLWIRQGVRLPGDEIHRALEALTAREVLTRTQPHRFVVDLHRIWLARHRSLDWVRQEIDGSIGEWRERSKRPAQDRASIERIVAEVAPILPVQYDLPAPPPVKWPEAPTEEAARSALLKWKRRRLVPPPETLFAGELEIMDKTRILLQEEWVMETRVETMERKPGRLGAEQLGLVMYGGSVQNAPGPSDKWVGAEWRGVQRESVAVLECGFCVNGKVRCADCEGDGYVECKPKQPCPKCSGLGSLFGSGGENTKCPVCHGIKTVDCGDCNGKGYRPCQADGCREGRVRCPQCENHLCYTIYRLGTVVQIVHSDPAPHPEYRLLHTSEKLQPTDVPERYRSQVRAQLKPPPEDAVRRRYRVWAHPRFEVGYDDVGVTRRARLIGEDLLPKVPHEDRLATRVLRLRQLLRNAWQKPAVRFGLLASAVAMAAASAVILLQAAGSP